MAETVVRLTPRPSRLSEADFVERFGDVYEHSPWIAREAYQLGLGEPQDTPQGLAEVMARVFRAADPERQLGVLRAHPDLAGKAALAGELTRDSSAEQASAGLDQCTPEEFSRFQTLNDAYQKRFGFPFIIAVKGLHCGDILKAFADRLEHDLEQERRTAVEQVNRIALLRLCDRVG
ncbi:2-oxo-4-hydroxy-4-carboxy-5-ureidoimidazoline decarboxylase [Alloalcanivorax xenomutans]|uniref:2-oxo-4-hydroxy-4-carboxy-5-ureidoimidazoline decarboxylase n=1 Tax=Alloalcanivorax xenomutans TaxID=1094342 RepID=UPI003BA8A0F6